MNIPWPVIVIFVIGTFLAVIEQTAKGKQKKPPPSISINGARKKNALFVGETTNYMHGTTKKNAREIYRTGLWLVGKNTPKSFPKGVYLTDDMEVAKNYSNSNGEIVLVKVKDGTKLTNQREGYYVFEIPDAIKGEEYYKIRNLKPVGIISPNGKTIK